MCVGVGRKTFEEEKVELRDVCGWGALMHPYMSVCVCVCLVTVDMWSVGCIFGEVIRGTVLFPGTDRILVSLCSPALISHISLSVCGT